MNSVITESKNLSAFILQHPKLVVLTGAGISLDSGIPTYRDDKGTWLPKPPIQDREFRQHTHIQQRYWTRSWYGWPTIRDAQPNASHSAIATLESLGHIDLLITQNVDGLHQKAGNRNVVDLHGRVDRAECMNCRKLHCRQKVQEQLEAQNVWPVNPQAASRPDGDMEIPEDSATNITLPRCCHCSGQLKPDVVFFGGAVPKTRVQTCLEALSTADALLVVGSSLTVFSGFRFCRYAHRNDTPIAIINQGVTRADELADTRLWSPAGPLLEQTLALINNSSAMTANLPDDTNPSP